MSKIGKKNIKVPKDSIKIEGGNLTITGPKGTKKLTINDKIFSSKLTESEFQILPVDKKIDKKLQSCGAHIGVWLIMLWQEYPQDMKILELSGVGFRANLKGEF